MSKGDTQEIPDEGDRFSGSADHNRVHPMVASGAAYLSSIAGKIAEHPELAPLKIAASGILTMAVATTALSEQVMQSCHEFHLGDLCVKVRYEVIAPENFDFYTFFAGYSKQAEVEDIIAASNASEASMVEDDRQAEAEEEARDDEPAAAGLS